MGLLKVLRYRLFGGKGDRDKPRAAHGRPGVSAYYSEPLAYYIQRYEEWRKFRCAPTTVDPHRDLKEYRNFEAKFKEKYTQYVDALAGIAAHGTASIPYALNMLKNAESAVREDAAGIFTGMGSDPGIVQEIILALANETDAQARDALIGALGHMKSKAAIPALAKILRDSNGHPDTLWGAAFSLGKVVGRRFDKNRDPTRAAREWLASHSYAEGPEP